MKRFAAVLLTLAVLLCPSVRAAGPGISAASAILIDGESGRVLYAQNAEEERPIASITKLMTALVAVESHPDLSEVVTILSLIHISTAWRRSRSAFWSSWRSSSWPPG